MRIRTSTQPMPTPLIDNYYSKRLHNTLEICIHGQDLTFAQIKNIYLSGRGMELNDKFVKFAGTPDFGWKIIMLHIY